jgi:hypothetical protein
MNMKIAKLHKFSRKFVGWITAAGPVIAYFLSMLTIIGGVTIYAIMIWPHNLFYQILAGVIAVLFALLVERLTLTQAAKVRISKEKKDDIETHYARIGNPTKETEINKKAEIKAVKDHGATLLMYSGALISTCAGTLFWHYILQDMPAWQAWGFSTLFSALISFTLVSSELHRHLENEVVSGSIMADHFTDLAGREDARDRIIQEFAGKHDHALKNALDHDTVDQIADYTAQQTIDGIFNGQGQIPMHIQREREAQRSAADREREKTSEQMQIIRDSRAKPKDEKPGLISGITGKLFTPSNNGNGHSPK